MTSVMSRYYVLTERDGVGVIEATTVDESHPFALRFIHGSKIDEFDRHDLLWWSAADSQPPAPFANLGARSPAHSTHHPGSARALSPWDGHPAMTAEFQHNANKSRRSAAAFSALVKATRTAVPEDWSEATLELKVSFELPENRYRIAHRLRNPGTGAESIDFSDTLFAAIDVFHRIEVENAENWNRCVLTLRMSGEGRCDAELDRENGMNFGPR